jgi:hypothetical protein
MSVECRSVACADRFHDSSPHQYPCSRSPTQQPHTIACVSASGPERDALFIETTFASHLMGFFAVIEEHQAELVTTWRTAPVNPLTLTAAGVQLAPHLAPDPARAAEVAAVFADESPVSCPRLWATMACIRTVTSGSFAVSLPCLAARRATLPIHSGTYTASEASLA